jgi:hypothetical protein
MEAGCMGTSLETTVARAWWDWDFMVAGSFLLLAVVVGY